jgi:hypothetical protein
MCKNVIKLYAQSLRQQSIQIDPNETFGQRSIRGDAEFIAKSFC